MKDVWTHRATLYNILVNCCILNWKRSGFSDAPPFSVVTHSFAHLSYVPLFTAISLLLCIYLENYVHLKYRLQCMLAQKHLYSKGFVQWVVLIVKGIKSVTANQVFFNFLYYLCNMYIYIFWISLLALECLCQHSGGKNVLHLQLQYRGIIIVFRWLC